MMLKTNSNPTHLTQYFQDLVDASKRDIDKWHVELKRDFNYYAEWIIEKMYKAKIEEGWYATIAKSKDPVKELETVIGSLKEHQDCWYPTNSSSQMINMMNNWRFEVCKSLIEQLERELRPFQK